jgi:hypothetical protein
MGILCRLALKICSSIGTCYHTQFSIRLRHSAVNKPTVPVSCNLPCRVCLPRVTPASKINLSIHVNALSRDIGILGGINP